MTKQESLVDAEWARALYVALCRYSDSPIYDEMVAKYGRPVLVVGSP